MKILSLCLLLTILLPFSSALGENLPSVDEALEMMAESDADRIQIDPAELTVFDPDNINKINYGDLKIIVFQRKVSEKEFTPLDSGAPDNPIDDFPEDFRGIDVTEPSVWLRCDIMRKIPAAKLAASMQEATIIVIAEDEYIHDGTLMISDYEEEDEPALPDSISSSEALVAYLSSQPQTLKSITYYPKFGVYACLNVYDADTKICNPYDFVYTSSRRFARNAEASDLWQSILEVESAESILSDADSKEAALEGLNSLILLPDSTVAFWKNCVDKGQFRTALDSADLTYWQLVSQMRNADTDLEHRKLYEMIQHDRSREALHLAVDYFSYSGFDLTAEEIDVQKLYFAVADPQWFEDVLARFAAALNE